MSIGYEWFSAKGTLIKEKNYLEIYKYEKQSENTLPPFFVGEVVPVVDSHVEESKTVVCMMNVFVDLLNIHPTTVYFSL